MECLGNPQPKFSEMLTKAERKEPMGMFRMGWIFDYPAMENYLGPLYSTTVRRTTTATAIRSSIACSPRATGPQRPEAATPLYQQAEDLLARDLPVLPMRFAKTNFGHSPRVTNVGSRPVQRM